MSSLYYCVNSEVGKGIEPHPTDEYHSVFFLTTFRLMERPLSQTQSCRWEMSGSQVLSHSLLILYQILSEMSSFFFTSSLFYCAFFSLAHSPQISSYFSYFSFGREGGEVVPGVKVCSRAHYYVGSSARFPTYTLSLLFYIGGRESFWFWVGD